MAGSGYGCGQARQGVGMEAILRRGGHYLGLSLALAISLWAAPAAAQRGPGVCAGEGGVTMSLRIKACNAIIKAGRATPHDLAVAYNNRGGAFYYGGQPERAIEDYNQAIKLDPDFAHAYNNRCWAGAVLGQTEQAVDDCSRVLRLYNIANTFENRAFAYLKMGQFDRAIADYETGLRLDPPNKADFLYGRGVARIKKGDAGGQADVDAAKALDPKIVERFGTYGLR